MASVYTNDLRLEEIGSGEQSGTWGDTTNTNLELIAEGLSFGTEAITTNADTHTSTVADGATDPARSMYIKYTGALDSDCTITIGPNTISRVHFIENATTDSGSSGPYNIIISQGSGANVTIPNGEVKAVYLDGAGSGAAVVDAFASLNVGALNLGTTADAASVSATASDYQLQLGAAQSTTGDIGRNISFGITGVTTAAINSVDAGTSNAQSLAFFTGNSSGITEAMRIDSSQNIGIGATSINRKLEISGNNNGGAKANYIRITDTDTTATADNQMGGIEFFSSDSSGGAGISASIETVYAGSGGGGELTFNTNATSGGTLTERMRIDESGNVGIGGSPSAKLDVRGGIRLGTTIADVADGGRPIIYASDGSGSHTGHALVIQGRDGSGSEIDFVTGTTPTTRMHVGSSGKIGIGVTDPDATLDISGGSNKLGILRIVQRASGAAAFGLDMGLDPTTGDPVFSRIVSDTVTEVMRIVRSSGDLLVGKTAANNTAAGHVLYAGGLQTVVKDDGTVQILNRLSSDGQIIAFRKDSTTIGSIRTTSGDLVICSNETNHSGFRFGSKQILPTNNSGTIIDNDVDLGDVSFRFDDIFATNGTIQTSDENEKQNIASLTSAEITAATAISKLFKTFKWKDQVEAKGDNARTHTGVVAQQVQSAMSDAGLDASKYAFWCSKTWWEKDVEVAAVEADEEKGIEAEDAYTRTDIYDTKDEAPEGATERTRMGVRYPELLAFIGAATEQRLTSIEARLDALEG
jgi:hypothetical protein